MAPRQGQRGVAHRRAHRLVDDRRRGLLDQLLVAALDRALALAEVDQVPVVVAEDLDLDVARRARRSARGTRGRRRSRARPRASAAASASSRSSARVDDAHALAAAAGRGLDQQRDSRWTRRQRGPRSRRAPARPARGGLRLAASLSPIAAMIAGGGPTQTQAGRLDRGGEGRVLGEVAVARVDGPRAARAAAASRMRVDVEVAGGQAHRLVGVGDERGRRRRRRRRRATARIPIARAARMTRRAISPRLAMSSESNSQPEHPVAARALDRGGCARPTGTAPARCGCRAGR